MPLFHVILLPGFGVLNHDALGRLLIADAHDAPLSPDCYMSSFLLKVSNTVKPIHLYLFICRWSNHWVLGIIQTIVIRSTKSHHPSKLFKRPTLQLCDVCFQHSFNFIFRCAILVGKNDFCGVFLTSFQQPQNPSIQFFTHDDLWFGWQDWWFVMQTIPLILCSSQI